LVHSSRAPRPLRRQESAEASLADAPEGVDDAPPPPSEVEHDDAYGLEGPLQPRTGEPVQAKPAGQPAVRSVQNFFSSPVPSPGEEPSAITRRRGGDASSVPASMRRLQPGARAPLPLSAVRLELLPVRPIQRAAWPLRRDRAEPAQPDLPGPPPGGPASGMGGREASLRRSPWMNQLGLRLRGPLTIRLRLCPAWARRPAGMRFGWPSQRCHARPSSPGPRPA